MPKQNKLKYETVGAEPGEAQENDPEGSGQQKEEELKFESGDHSVAEMIQHETGIKSVEYGHINMISPMSTSERFLISGISQLSVLSSADLSIIAQADHPKSVSTAFEAGPPSVDSGE